MKERTEIWRDGNTYRILRTDRGHFIKRELIATSTTRKGGVKGAIHIFRSSFAVNNIPVHSDESHHRAKYHGFLFQAYHLSKEYLRNKERDLKRIFIDNIENYIGYKKADFWFDVIIMGTERAIELSGFYDVRMSNQWTFQVEVNGQVKYNKEGEF